MVNFKEHITNSAGDKDLTLETYHGVFNHRVGCICLNSSLDSILLQYSTNSDFWFPLGGRIQFGEDSATALKREMKEELGVDIIDEQFHLAAYVENFFNYDNDEFHEISPFYRLILPNDFTPPTHDIDGDPITLAWHKLQDLNTITVMPPFIQQFKDKLKTGFHHVVINQ